MSARRPAVGRGTCDCSNITIMQLFHELKQQFPAVPDDIVNACISDHCHDRPACRARLQREADHQPRALPYPPSLMGRPYRQGPPSTARTDADGSDQQKMNENLNSATHHRQHSAYYSNNQTTCASNRTHDNSNSNSLNPNNRTLDAPNTLTTCVSNRTFNDNTGSHLQSPNNRIFNENPSFNISRKPYDDPFSNLFNAPRSRTVSRESSESFSNCTESWSKTVLSNNRNVIDERLSNVSISPSLDDPNFCTSRSNSLESSSRTVYRGASPISSQLRETYDDSQSNSCPRSNYQESSTKTVFRDSDTRSYRDAEFSKSPISFGVTSPHRTSIEDLSRSQITPRDSPTRSKPLNSPSPSRSFDPRPPDPRSKLESVGKPPISPCLNKRFGAKPQKSYDGKVSKVPEDPRPVNCDLGAVKKPPIRPATLDLPKPEPTSVNLSVNVNCSVDLSPAPAKHSSVLQVTPEPTWLHQDLQSPRSYTSVNLTLRTPTSEPQAPIDICSANSSLTYTTSSFDSKQGLQSRLQITVGPGGMGSVSAVRTRPRSSYHPVEVPEEEMPVRGSSMPDLLITKGTTNHILLVSRQLVRKEQLKSELESGRDRLCVIKKEVQALRLENTPSYRDHLQKQIRHLQAQCERLTQEVDKHSESRVPLGETNEEFYRHIYTGQRGSLRSQRPMNTGSQRPMNTGSQRPMNTGSQRPYRNSVNEPDEPRWPCHICTFRNHPLMDKCEQCEMPRILLVSAGPGENIHIRFSPGNSTRVIHSWVV